MPLLKEPDDDVVETPPKTEFVCNPVDEPPNKLEAVVAPPNNEVFACEVIELLNNEVVDALLSWLVPPNTLLF